MATLRHELVIGFSKDRDGNIGVGFYAVHGDMIAKAKEAGLPIVDTKGAAANALTLQVKAFVQKLGLERKPFKTSSGRQYASYTMPAAAPAPAPEPTKAPEPQPKKRGGRKAAVAAA